MKAIAFLLLCLPLCSCGAPRQLTLEEQDAWMVRQQCSQMADNSFPEWPGPDNPAWASCYIECMNSFGVPDAVIYRMWD